MDEPKRDRSKSPAVARGKWSLLNGGIPPRDRNKLNSVWAQKLWTLVKEHDNLIDKEEIQKAERAAKEVVLIAANVLSQLCGEARTALYFYNLACVIDPCGQAGRPPGSKTHDANHLVDLKRMVVLQEDGSTAGRSKAIAVALADELPEHRPALKKRLRRELPPLHTER